jgi:tetratricopeptide (TPR) repeat protein
MRFLLVSICLFAAAQAHAYTQARLDCGHYDYKSGPAELEKALDGCNRALVEDPSDVRALYFRGNIHSNRGEYELALADADRILAMAPTYKDGYEMRGILLTRYLKRDYDKAISDLKRLIELTDAEKKKDDPAYPGFALYWVDLGEAYLGKGDKGAAIKAYSKALEIIPTDEETIKILVGLGVKLVKIQNYAGYEVYKEPEFLKPGDKIKSYQ